ncbi:MAG: aminoacyl-tRNA hydrolase [Candidatus Methylomirabilia bacterium]
MAQAVVGLGNPGTRYEGTRHNVGHRVMESLVDLLREQGELLHGFRRVSRLGQVAEGQYATETVVLFKPLGYMNESGPAVARFLRQFEDRGLAPADVILVYDDIDLPVGKLRVRMKGSSGGHRGVQSVIDHLGTQALRRVKVGIGRPPSQDEVVDHVLSRFSPDELPLIDTACTVAVLQVVKLLAERTPPTK